ncbi:MAG: zinc ribbon domain-containing protein, partial [Gammaproteobacteria bacterium]|nr:zinc ribbon domain-containing protein [Gammaproteobacteria bacterium]
MSTCNRPALRRWKDKLPSTFEEQIMALSKCKECGKKVSSTAKKCPHCGVKKPVAAPAPGAFESIFGIIVVVGLLWWWFYDPEPEAGTEQTRQVADINKYVSGKKHGHWVERLSNSSMAEGPYVNGKRHG